MRSIIVGGEWGNPPFYTKSVLSQQTYTMYKKIVEKISSYCKIILKEKVKTEMT